MLYYLYGITSSDNSLSAVPAASVEKVVCSDLLALVEPVADGDFAPDALEASLGSLDWVARTARKHEALLEAAMASGPVVPARLCTLFKDTGAVLRSLTDNHPRLSSMLGRLRHRSEWGLKVYCDEARLRETLGNSDPEMCALAEAALTASPGRMYLLTKKREARRLEITRARIEEAVDEILGALETLPIALRQKAALSGDVTGHSEPMVLNLAALVGDQELFAYHAEVQVLATALSADGFVFETSGPWPAYSFSDEDGDEGDVESEDKLGDGLRKMPVFAESGA